MSRRVKEHKRYKGIDFEHYDIGYIRIDDLYLDDAETMFIYELQPKWNIAKKELPTRLKGCKVDWDYIIPQLKAFGFKDIRIADHFSALQNI